MSGTSSEIWTLCTRAAYLVTSVGTTEEDTRRLAGEGGGLTRLTKVGQGSDLALYETLLTEPGRGDSHDGGNDNSFGKHIE